MPGTPYNAKTATACRPAPRTGPLTSNGLCSLHIRAVPARGGMEITMTQQVCVRVIEEYARHNGYADLLRKSAACTTGICPASKHSARSEPASREYDQLHPGIAAVPCQERSPAGWHMRSRE